MVIFLEKKMEELGDEILIITKGGFISIVERDNCYNVTFYVNQSGFLIFEDFVSIKQLDVENVINDLLK